MVVYLRKADHVENGLERQGSGYPGLLISRVYLFRVYRELSRKHKAVGCIWARAESFSVLKSRGYKFFGCWRNVPHRAH